MRFSVRNLLLLLLVVPTPSSGVAAPLAGRLAIRNAPSTSVDRHVLTSLKSPTPEQKSLWNYLATNQLGVAGNAARCLSDHQAHQRVFGQGIERWFWAPQGWKRTICGKLSKYERTGDYASVDDYASDFVHDQVVDDHDWNLQVRPTGTFVGTLESVENGVNPSNASKLNSYSPAALRHKGIVEGESFVPDEIDEYALSLNGGQLTEPNLPVCIEGAMVVDWTSIDPAIEIHPAEQIWFNSLGMNLVSIADYSGRFDTPDDFFLPQRSLDGGSCAFVPWAATPLASEFWVQFTLPSLNAAKRYSIWTEAANNAAAVAPHAPVHVLTYGDPRGGADREILRVEELASWQGALYSVDFRDVAKYDDGSIRGYIILKSTLGSAGHPGGYLRLRMVEGLVGLYSVHLEGIRALPRAATSSTDPARVVPLVAEGDEIKVKAMSVVDMTSRRITLGRGGYVSSEGLDVETVAGPGMFGVGFSVGVETNEGVSLGSAWVWVPQSNFGNSRSVLVRRRIKLPHPPHLKKLNEEAQLAARTGKSVETLEVTYRVTKEAIQPIAYPDVSPSR